MSDVAEATPQSGSLEEASRVIAGLLSPREDTPSRKTPPEQVPSPAEKVEEPKQVPAAPETERPESEQVKSEEASSDEAKVAEEQSSQPKTWKVPVAGEEVEVTEDELLKGYSRTADYTRKTQALADEKRQWLEGDAKAARELRAQQESYLGELKTAIERLAPVEPNWDQLAAAVSPDVWQAERKAWDQRQAQLATITAEQDRLAAERAKDAETGFKAHIADQQAKLELELPDFKHPEKAAALKQDLATFAKSRGFTDDDLSQVTDHRVVLLLHDAMLHARAQQKAPAIQNRIEKVLETSVPGSPRTTTPRSKLDAAQERLKRSGSLEDGAAVIAHLL